MSRVRYDDDGPSAVGSLVLRGGKDIDCRNTGLDAGGEESGGIAECEGGVEESFVDADGPGGGGGNEEAHLYSVSMDM